ncbi:MAG: ParB/RepB/Spo0J family partition protein [Sulfurovum sp.]|nr:ParB/RepB/Spo0J family partition protein [Sulfurovum sp.]
MAKKKYDIDALLEAGEDAHLTDNFVNITQANRVDGEQYIKLNISEIEPNPLQPRKTVKDEELKELAKSIKLHGLIHPITVMKISDKKLVLLAGQRRLLAYKYLKKEEIPAIVREDERFKNLAKLDMLNDATISKILFEISVSENESREPLTPLELALSIDEVLKKKVYTSVNEVAKVLGKSKAYISKIYSTLKLAKPILKDIEETRGVGHIEALYELQKIKDQTLQVELYEKLKAGEINIDNIKVYSVTKKKNNIIYDFKISKNNIFLKINTKALNEKEKNNMNEELQAIVDKYIEKNK